MQETGKPLRVVVKVGSSTLSHDTGRLNLRTIELLCRVMSDLAGRGHTLALVTSGAISAGNAKLGVCAPSEKMRHKQAAAAVGQCELMYLYDRFFSEYGRTVAQILLTRDVVDERERRENVVGTFEALFSYGVVPVVNENDSVSVDEIEQVHRFGDNDTLSAIVAKLIGADFLVLLSDIDGLYDGNPADPGSRLIPVVEKIDESVEALAGGSGSAFGTGGMKTKLAAARLVTQAGIGMFIAKGSDPHVLYDIFDGKPVGTYFKPAGGRADK